MNQTTHNEIEPIKIALLAVGGDGGGVLTDWVVKMAEAKGYWAQSTSIAGVAQRTGATVYYIELFPLPQHLSANGRIITPVLAQMPAPQDVDIVMATELMEAGRALQRGFVSKKTTLIFSTNRNLAIKEKETPGDGIIDGQSIFDLTNKYAKKSLYANLKLIAVKNKSVVSASMFGALAASGSLPGFKKEDYIQTIKHESPKGVENSLLAFQEAYQYITDSIKQPKPYIPELSRAKFDKMPESAGSKTINLFINDIKNNFPSQTHDIIYTGVNHLIDWQNVKYAKEYLKKLEGILKIDNQENDFLLTQNVARYLAIGMSYDDLIFVADQKTRKERTKEVYHQVGAKENEIVNILDYLHPGFYEVSGFLPVGIGKKVVKSEKLQNWYKKYFDRDRRMRSTGLFNFLLLYFMGGLKGWRLKTLRHHEEMENINEWLDHIYLAAKENYDLAVQIAKTYRLKKGYGDTYARGHSKFKIVNDYAIHNLNKSDINERLEHLIAFALQNPDASRLEKLINQM